MKLPFIFSILGFGLLMAVIAVAKPGMLMSNNEQRLFEAVAQNDFSTLQALVKENINVNAQDVRGRTPLLVAVEKHHVESAKVLLEADTDVNIQDQQQDSPLLLAGDEGTVDIMEYMLNAKPDFTRYNRFGGTPLIRAVERGHVDMVKLLVNTTVAIDHENYLGWTALLEAIILGDGGPRHQKIVQALVDAGANVDISDMGGVTALRHAKQNGFDEIVKILEVAGASLNRTIVAKKSRNTRS